MVLVVVILLGLLVARLRRGPAGRMLLAIRSNERAAGSVGINVAQGKLMAFGLAAFIAGIGGALTGYTQGELTADSFAAFTSISLLAIVFVAGVGRIAGAVVAGIMFSAAGLFVTFLDIHLSVGKYQAIVAGVALVLTAVQNPDGLTSTSTGKGPAVALEKLQGRLVGQYRKRRAGWARADRLGVGGNPGRGRPRAGTPARAELVAAGGVFGPARVPGAHRRRLRHRPGGERGPVVRPGAGLRPLPPLRWGAGQGVDRPRRERVERSGRARVGAARGGGLDGSLDRRGGGVPRCAGIARRLVGQDQLRGSPVW